MKLYWTYITTFFKILSTMKEYQSFLYRESLPNKGIKPFLRILQGRMYNEQRGGRPMSRENTFLYLTTITCLEENPSDSKEDLFTLLAILFLWYCEPLPESELPAE